MAQSDGIDGKLNSQTARDKDVSTRSDSLARVSHLEKYLPCLDDDDASEQQKIEFLQALYAIMASFVDLGFGVDSVSLLFPEIFEHDGEQESMVTSSHTSNSVHEEVPAGKSAGERAES